MGNSLLFVKILFSSLSLVFLLGSGALFFVGESALAFTLLVPFGLFLTLTTIIFLVEPPRPNRFIRLTQFKRIRID